MKNISIKQNSWIAAVAARRLGYRYLAMVIGKTIHLHNVNTAEFVRNKRWLIHELKHVDQFQQHGFLSFLWLYMKEHLRSGYYNNKYELEARNAETDESLLKKYDISPYFKVMS
ncbi:DUF4157 domain-containing protein [Polluticoccus soli]|uniref:DUF4157 domain-containing protein n=1 Tax=Polluticoccus soli TaxID=3034150 RepID=UPI0023E2947C|nr:DUF4157 domain-containing protein [Flavipsychrobacter sp. JY13-12]